MICAFEVLFKKSFSDFSRSQRYSPTFSSVKYKNVTYDKVAHYTLLLIGCSKEMQIEITVIQHFTSIRLTEIFKV